LAKENQIIKIKPNTINERNKILTVESAFFSAFLSLICFLFMAFSFYHADKEKIKS
jgi:hypothetical protein